MGRKRKGQGNGMGMDGRKKEAAGYPGPFGGQGGGGGARERRRVKREWKRSGKWATLVLFLACAAAMAVSLLFEGPRNLYAKAVFICLDCIGLI